MRRREFIAGLGAATWPVLGRAQSIPVIGFLGSGSPATSTNRLTAFRLGLGESGFEEGRNVTIEYRWADGMNERLPAMAAELVRQKVSAIFAGGGAAALAAKASTTSIPIIFTTANDPVETGLVTSLNRPGGNLTGATNLNVELAQKRLELLHELVPTLGTVVLLVNSSNPKAAETETRELQSVVTKLGLKFNVVQSRGNLEQSFAELALIRAAALVIGADAFFNSRSQELGLLASRHHVPAIHNSREFATAGGLVSYGGAGGDTYRVAGVYAGRILKGDRPSDLPVQQSTKIEMVINLKTAKTLGLTVPPTLLARADEVIE